MKNQEILNVSGHLQIIKVYKDGTEEKIYEDHNVITSGLGVGLANLFIGQGSSIEDFQIRYFQAGSGAATPTVYDYKTYKLLAPLDQETHYGAAITSEHKRMKPDGKGSTAELFAFIPDNAIKKSSPTSVTYILYLSEGANPDEDLNEIALFMNNPFATLINQDKISPMVAYRQFSSISKSTEFSLVFKWKLSF